MGKPQFKMKKMPPLTKQKWQLALEAKKAEQEKEESKPE